MGTVFLPYFKKNLYTYLIYTQKLSNLTDIYF